MAGIDKEAYLKRMREKGGAKADPPAPAGDDDGDEGGEYEGGGGGEKAVMAALEQAKSAIEKAIEACRRG